MKATSYQTLTAKFHDLLKESQAVQSEYKRSVKEKMTRQIRLIDGDVTDKKINEICNDPEVRIAVQNIGKINLPVFTGNDEVYGSDNVWLGTHSTKECCFRHSR